MSNHAAQAVTSDHPGGDKRGSLVWLLCAALLVLASVPILLNTYPPLVDYPFHIGRIAILEEWHDSAFLQEHYAISSYLLPNLALDLVMLPIADVVGIGRGADIFLLLTLGLILTGTVRLHQVLYGSTSYWPLVAAPFLYNWILLFGFLNYCFAIGVLLWCLAGWVAMAPRPAWLRLLAGSCFALFLFFSHLVAFGLYAVAVAGFELQRAFSRWRESGRLELAGLVAGAAQFAVPVAIFFYASPSRAIASGKPDYDFFAKAGSVIVTLTSGAPAMDLVTAAVLVVGAVLVLMFGRAQLARSFILPLVVLLLTFLALPHGMGPGTLVDIRVPAALLFILIAASRVSFRRLVVARAFAGLVGALLLVKIAGLSWSWLAFDTLVGQYIAAFDRLAPESTLFVARQAVPRSWAQRMYVDRVREPPHVASLAALREDVFVPSLFAAPGAQPIELQPRFARMNAYQGFWAVEVGTEEPLDEAVDTFIGLQREASPSKAAYLLLFDRATPPLAPPDDARLIAAGPGFRLFEIYTPPGRG